MNKREIRQLMCAMTIGDGHISKRDGALIVEHGASQEDYLHWKADLLDNVFIDKEINRRCRRRKTRQKCRGKYFDAFRFELYWKEFIGKHLRPKAYRLDYERGRHRKNVEYLLSQLQSDLHVAIWFMDDGGEMGRRFRANGQQMVPWLGLFTCEFTLGQVNLTAEWFRSRFDCDPTVSYYKQKDYHYLRFPPEQVPVLHQRLSPYFRQLSSMRKKFEHSFQTLSSGEGPEAKEEAPHAGEDMVQQAPVA